MPKVTAMTADVPVCAAADSASGMEHRTSNPLGNGSFCAPWSDGGMIRGVRRSSWRGGNATRVCGVTGRGWSYW